MNLNKIKKAAKRGFEGIGASTAAVFYKNKFNTADECYAHLEKIHKDVKSSAIREKKEDFSLSDWDVSVIMTTYNRANLVERCINSILSQKTDYKAELLFINDGSKDNTKEILEKYKDLPNVRIINQENKGLSETRNTAINNAKGKYILFVDDDDILAPHAIQTLLDASDNGKYDIVEGNMARINIAREETVKNKSYNGIVKKALGTLEGFACGKIYRKTLFSRIKFPKGYWFEDSINAALIYNNNLKAFVVNDVVYKYFATEGSITSSINNPKNLDSIYITIQLLKDRKKLGLPFKQENYEYFLRMIHLTYQRTRVFDTGIKYAIFQIQRALYNNYYQEFHTEKSGYLKKIEHSIRTNNFRQYIRCCELHI